MPFELLARALGATAEPPKLLVLNGRDTLDGADVLLGDHPAVIAMATEVSDLAASAFAARFYAVVAQHSRSGRRCARGQSCWTSWAWTRAGSPTCSPASTSPSMTWSLVQVLGE